MSENRESKKLSDSLAVLLVEETAGMQVIHG
jgi:hypothetical protein